MRSLLVGHTLRSVTYRQLKGLEDREFWVRDGWHLAVSGVHLSTDTSRVFVTWGGDYVQYAIDVIDEAEYPFSPDPEYDPGPGGPDAGDGWDDLIGTAITEVATCWFEVEPRSPLAAPAAVRLSFAGGRMLWIVAAMELDSSPGMWWFADEIVVVFTADKMREFGFTDSQLGLS